MKTYLIIAAVGAVLLASVLFAFVTLNRKYEKSQNELKSALELVENTQKRLETAESLCKYERERANRSELAMAHFEAAKKEVYNPTEKMKEVGHDQDSCDWLDAVIPDGIRLCLEPPAGNTCAVCE